MAKFYILPPRSILRDQLRKLLEAYLPGIKIDEEYLLELFSHQSSQDQIILHREDLPEQVDTMDALRDLFGAEAGDLIFQISAGPCLDQPRIARLDSLKIAA